MFKHHLHMHFIVLLWGFTAIIGNEIAAESIEIVFFRTLVAALGLGAIILFNKNARPWPSKTDLAKFVANGAVVGLHWLLFFGATKVSKVSICLAGMATTTLFTAILEPLILRTRMKWYEVMLGLMVIAGLYTIFQFEFQYALGLFMALGSAFLGALFSVINKRFTRHQMPLRISFMEMIGACLVAAALMPVHQMAFPELTLKLSLSFRDWMLLLALALVCTVYAFYFSLRILEKLSAFTVNLTINMEPVYGIIIALLIYGESEHLSSGFYWGALIIIGAVAVHPLLDRRFNPERRRKKEEAKMAA